MSQFSDIRNAMRALIEIEAAAVASLLPRLGEDSDRAVALLAGCTSKVVVSGLGKTGIVARKFAATLSSVGTPACFIHASDAEHGDLGMVCDGDVLVAISNSGQTPEVVDLAARAKSRGVAVIALTGDTDSPLGRVSDVALDVGVAAEGDPLGIVPMASTTVALVMADALVAGLMTAKKISKDDFAQHHPGGSLGNLLLLSVRDLMHERGDTPVVSVEVSFKEALYEMTSKRLGATFVVNGEGVLSGIITDGDLRRILGEHANPLECVLSDIMITDPKNIHEDMMAIDAMRLMEDFAITVLPVVDEDHRVVSAIHMHDLVKAGLAPLDE